MVRCSGSAPTSRAEAFDVVVLHCFQFSCYSFWFRIRSCDSNIEEGYMLHTRRDPATLLPVIGQYVVPGTTIVSDQGAAYTTIKDMSEGYQQEAVNYSLHFTDPESGAWTNRIESIWQKFKEGHKSQDGTERALLNSYMDEFIWKKNVWGQCAAPPLVSDSWTLCTPRFRLKVRDYVSAPNGSALWQSNFWKVPRMKGADASFSPGFPTWERS